MANKKKAIKTHFQRRSLERIGVLLDEKELVKKIQNNKLEFIEKQSNRISVFRYEYNNNFYRLIYDKTRKQIVTILFERSNDNGRTKQLKIME